VSFSVDSEKALAPSKEIDDDNINLNADGTKFYSDSFLTKEMDDIDSSRSQIPITTNNECPSTDFKLTSTDANKSIKDLLVDDLKEGFRNAGRECNNVAVDYINATEMVSLCVIYQSVSC